MAAAVMNGTVNYFVGRQDTLRNMDTANLSGKNVTTDYFVARNETNGFPDLDLDMNVSDKNGSVNYFVDRDDSLHNFPVSSNVPEKTDQFDLHFSNQSVVSDDISHLIANDGTVPDTQILDLHNSHPDLNIDQLDNGMKTNKSDCSLKAPPRVIGLCKVCGDEASGMYFGALVCVPCKTFFLRYAGDNSFVCKRSKNCEITVYSRTHCKYCRMMKCLNVGMCRKERPDQVQITEGQQLCIVCQDLANGIHFGAITCEGCKKFFRRGLTEHQSYTCKNDKNCVINPRTRNACRFCRFQKCLRAGMSREAIQMGRPSKVRYNQDNHLHGCELEKKRPHLDSSGDSGHSSTHSSPILRVPDHFLSYSDIFNRPLLQCDVQSLSGTLSGVPSKASADIILGSFDFLQPSFALQQPLAAVSASSSLPMYQTLVNISTIGDIKPQILQQNQVQHTIVQQQQQRVSLPPSDIWALQPNKFDAKSVNYFSDLLSEESAELPRIMPVEIPTSRESLGMGDSDRSLAVLSTLNNVTLPEISSTATHWSCTNSGIDVNLRNILKVEKEKALELCHTDLTCGSVITDWGVDNEDTMSPKVENGIALSEIMGEHNAEAGKDIQSSFAGSVLQVNVDSLEVPAPSEQSMVVQYRDNYWTDSTLPNEDIFLSEEHMKIVQDILAAYNRFVDTGSNINQQLRREFDNLRAQGIPEAETVEKLHARIHFLYTVSSVTYCQSLPGFRAFNRADQYRLIRLGQSQSRMLVAACHWYMPESDNFKDFMFWRDNTYPVKLHLLEFSREFHKLHLDRVEAALMNTLIITATDYPGLENSSAIEDHRQTVLKAFRAYTTAVYGSRNKRLEMLFSYVPRLRELGNEHHKSTFDISITSNVPASSVTQTVTSQAAIDPE